jgi:hypothetical protein
VKAWLRVALSFLFVVLSPNVSGESLVNSCSPDTLESAMQRSLAVFWVTDQGQTEEGFEGRIVWIKKRELSSRLLNELDIKNECTRLIFIGNDGRQFVPCARWGQGISLPSEAVLLSQAMLSKIKCRAHCTKKLEDRLFVLAGLAYDGEPFEMPYDSEERRRLIDKAAERDRRLYPEILLRRNTDVTSVCFSSTRSALMRAAGL